MKFLYLTALIFLCSCSNKALYDNIQTNNRHECAKLPPSQYDECLERAEVSYEEYERQRNKALEKQ